MEKDDEHLEELSRTKAFSELSPEEESFVLDRLGSEEEYTNLRRVEAELRSADAKTLQPRPETLSALKMHLDHTHRAQTGWIFRISVPAYATVLLVIGASALSAWLASGNNQGPRAEARTITKVDTVYVSRVDTVFRERTVFKTILATSVLPCAEKKTSESGESPKGVSMKDQGELDKLIVTGSEP